MWNLFKFTIQISTFVALVTWLFVLYGRSIGTQNALRIIIKHELDLQVLHKLVVVKHFFVITISFDFIKFKDFK